MYFVLTKHQRVADKRTGADKTHRQSTNRYSMKPFKDVY